MLASHPDIQNELRNECFDLPSYKAGELPNTTEIKGMKCPHNVVREGKSQVHELNSHGFLTLTTPMQFFDYIHQFPAILDLL